MNEGLRTCPVCGGEGTYERHEGGEEMTQNLYLDIDVVRDASGELLANVDFSRYVGHVKEEFAQKIDAAILDGVEPKLNELGWVKERTCRIIEDGYMDDPATCSYCGTHYDGGRYCKHCGARVLTDEEQGHMVADSIRMLEEALKG